IAAGLVSAAAIFAAGVLYFRQTERVFADVA
ncbi:MAG: phosphate ABC transporter permease, partial [Chloroflexi bacterium]